MCAGLAIAALGGGCGQDERCSVEILAPCPDCGSGEVVRAARGETAVSARPGGGYAAACDEHLVWHAADFSIDRMVRLADPDRAVAAVAVGADDVAYVAIRNRQANDPDWELAAVSPDGDELWRHDLEFHSRAVTLVATASFVYAYALQQPLDEFEPGKYWVITRRQVNGVHGWTWQSPDTWSDDVSFRTLQFVPRDDGGGTLYALMAGELDLGDAGVLTGDGPVAIELDPSGVPVSGRHLDELGRAQPRVRSFDESGGMAMAGYYYDHLELGAAVALESPDSLTGFVARFQPDGTPLWATNVDLPEDAELTGIVMAGEVAVVSGFSVGGLGLSRPEDGFVVGVRDGSVDWRNDAAGPHHESVSGPALTAGGAALVAVTVLANSQVDVAPVLDFGGVHIELDDDVVASPVPDDGVVAELVP